MSANTKDDEPLSLSGPVETSNEDDARVARSSSYAVLLSLSAAGGQWREYPAKGIPRLKDAF